MINNTQDYTPQSFSRYLFSMCASFAIATANLGEREGVILIKLRYPFHSRLKQRSDQTQSDTSGGAKDVIKI